ncbi:MAG TPA: CHAT domain-containing protein [Thermoanaerobaculia bacterium]|nr:CHAT domain-containing protein [Thermoanaerobaculia bacterium]
MPFPILWLAMALDLQPARDPAAVARERLATDAAAKCARLVSATVEVRAQDEHGAVVEASHTWLLAGTLDGGISRRSTAHSRLTLERTASGWAIVKHEALEGELVERLSAATAEERDRLFAASPELHTETFIGRAAEATTRFVNQSRIDEAAAMAGYAMEAAERLGDPRSLAEALSARSIVARYARPRRNDLAEDLAREAALFAESAGDADMLARALVRQGRAAESVRGKLDTAALERALALADRLEDPSAAAHAAIHLGRSMETRGNGREAFRYAAMAMRFAEQSDDAGARISAALMLGGAYMWHSEHEIAIRYFRQAAEQAEKAGFPGVVAFTYATISNALGILERDAEALQMIEEGLRRFPGAEGVPLLESRMGMHITAGRYAAGEADLLRRIELDPPQADTEKQIESHFAWLRLLQGQYPSALEHARRSRGGTEAIDFHASLAEAAALRCLGRPQEAIERLEELVMAYENADETPKTPIDPQNEPFVGSSNGHHDLLAELLAEQGHIHRALEVSEMAKATLLRDVLRRSGLDPAKTAGAAERRQEQALEERIRGLNLAVLAGGHTNEASALFEQLTAARADLVDFRHRAFATRPALRARHPWTFDLAALPPSLDHVTIVSYVELPAQTLIFAVSPKQGGRRRVELHIAPIRRQDLRRKVQRLSELVEQRNLRAGSLATELYELLIAPVEHAVVNARALCIVPDHDLWNVPFHALSSRDGKAVIDRTAVFYASSISVLAAAESRRQERAPARDHVLLAFANPTVSAETEARYRVFDPTTPLGALPETETEVRAIARIYGREKSRVHIGQEARESTLKREAGRYNVLHIASHGLVHKSAPMFSSIVLAATGEEAEDGLLEAREIVGLELDAELTVLSACDTGRSSNSPSRGVMGLSWAFLAAGCPTTAVSLWSAESTATSMLMIEFHRQLARGRSKAEALRAAQLRLRRDPRYGHMFYWAPFVVMGAP